MDAKESGDRKVWRLEYEKACVLLDRGNMVEARKIFRKLAEESPFEEIKESARVKLGRFRIDWLAIAFFGLTLAVLSIISAVWIF